MRLLIVTQVVDVQDPGLGFFVRWIEELAKRIERVEVICLKKGAYELPANVHVHSLGKEEGRPLLGTLTYLVRFRILAWRLRRNYDAVFVHMNQEYILTMGLCWKLLKKPVYLWRNHYAGSWFTNVAVAFCTKVFCTSEHSYTARFTKTVRMPVGVDTELFYQNIHIHRQDRSILSFGRIAPSKRLELLLDALAILAREGVAFSATFVGSPLPDDTEYYDSLKEKASPLGNRVSFMPGVPKEVAPDFFRTHSVFVNTSPSGMLDKTIFEAAACGCQVLTSSEDIAESVGHVSYFDSAGKLAERLKEMLEKTHEQPERLQALVKENTLSRLAERLQQEFESPPPAEHHA